MQFTWTLGKHNHSISSAKQIKIFWLIEDCPYYCLPSSSRLSKCHVFKGGLFVGIQKSWLDPVCIEDTVLGTMPAMITNLVSSCTLQLVFDWQFAFFLFRKSTCTLEKLQVGMWFNHPYPKLVEILFWNASTKKNSYETVCLVLGKMTIKNMMVSLDPSIISCLT